MNGIEGKSYKEVKQRVIAQVKSCQFKQATELALLYKTEIEKSKPKDIESKSQSLKLYIYSLIKSEQYGLATHLVVNELEPLLSDLDKYKPVPNKSKARLFYTRQIVDDKIFHKDTFRNITPLKQLYDKH